MKFWQAQDSARRQTTLLLLCFAALTLAAATAIELILRAVVPDTYHLRYPLIGLLFLASTFLVAYYNYSMYQMHGGSYVAESIGAKKVQPNTSDLNEQKLRNIVEETALAASLPVPVIYIIEAEKINAFAAGLDRNGAAIAVTRGSLKKLSRDELQGVIAHEFGHIENGDMAISLRLAAMLMGFFFILYFGLRALQFASLSRGSRGKGNQLIVIAALLLIAAGVLTWLFGSILKSLISRQREYLADASAVQYTRSPHGIAGALIKIRDDSQKTQDMPKQGTAYAHMYFDHASFGGLFATHPPLQKRINRILGVKKTG